MVASINGYIIFSLIFTSAYMIGLLTFFAENEKDKCDMTYMFERPQYVRISNDFDKYFPKYSLYLYDEGPPYKHTPKVWGIPVLFIPGNAGSHKQARSLASVALRKATNKRLPYHLDYFTIDMNEELTGLSGIFLKDQLDYVNRSLHFILTLYRNQKYSPSSVILIGHSMGGVIARKLAQMAESPIQIVITLASPHLRSPIILDQYISSFYKDVKTPIRSDITFISLSGGYSDLLVPSPLSNPKDNKSIYAVTTHIPLSWAAADHKQILWCRQTVLAITRALFDSVNPGNRQISSSSEYIRRIFEHHLLHHSGINAKFRKKYDSRVAIEGDAQWIEKSEQQYSVRFLKGTKDLRWYMVKLENNLKYEMLTVVALNLKTVDWIFACGAYIPKKNYKVCEDGMHLSHLSSIDPSSRYKRRSLTINLLDLKKNYSDEFSHVIFKVAPTSEPIVFHIDVYKAKDRMIDFKLPNWADLWRKVIIPETADNSLSYKINLPDLTHIIHSFYLYLRPLNCTKDNHHATASLMIPWSNENSHKHFTDEDIDPFHVRLYNSKPNDTEKSAFLKLTLDPTCRYKVSIQRSVRGSLSQLARLYTPLLIVNVATVVLLILKTQLQSLGSKQECASFFYALKSGTKPYYVLGSAKLGMALLSSSAFSKVSPVSNWHVLREEGIDFLLLPYIMYLISIGVIWIFAFAVTIWITFCESAIHKIFLKFLTKTVPFTVIWSEHVIAVLQKIPSLVSTIIILISYNTCGGLALALGTIFYFLKLTKMSQEYIEETVFTLIKSFILKFQLKGKSGNRKTNENSTTESTTKATNEVEEAETSSKNAKHENNQNGTRSIAKISETGPKNSENISEIGNNTEGKKDNHVVPKISPPSTISFHGVMFLIWVLTTIINGPSTITWARNFTYNVSLQPDPSFVPGFLLSLCTLPLWQFDIPNTKKKWYIEVSYLINVIAVIALISAPIYIYRLNYLLSAVVVIIVAHQILAPNLSSESPETEDEDRIKYENIKTKLE